MADDNEGLFQNACQFFVLFFFFFFCLCFFLKKNVPFVSVQDESVQSQYDKVWASDSIIFFFFFFSSFLFLFFVSE
jgi:hypothetical protein